MGGRGSRVGVDLAPSNPAGSIPRHPMARRAKALAVIRADPDTRVLFPSSGNVRPHPCGPANVTTSSDLRRDEAEFRVWCSFYLIK